jgi:L-aspartate oxidase
VVHRGDRTGAELVRVLYGQVRNNRNIRISDTLEVRDLLVEEDTQGRRCTGVRAVDVRTGVIISHHADVVVLATGGSGRMYRHTTNPAGATGAGVAMALRAGVPVRDMAFVQFHPTALYAPEEADVFLISEALRGAGALLLRPDGSRLMEGVHPMADLAPRNVVARAIHAVMLKEHAAHVWLDATHLGQARFSREFPMILDHCWSVGIDPLHQPIPVMPAAHYVCGGIRTDADGRTALPGLFALGECAGSGLHGADRLASNSLLEALVIPRHAAAAVAEMPMAQDLPDDGPVGRYALLPASKSTGVLCTMLQNTMMDDVGIVRTHTGLRRAKASLALVRAGTEENWQAGERSLGLMELRDMVAVAEAVCAQAIAETANAGSHWNEDLVETKDLHPEGEHA